MKSALSCLSNGVRVATCEMPHAHTVAVGIWAEVGGRYEPAPKSGIAHFIEHLLFKGTARRTPRQISQAVEGVGGYLNAFTAEEHTCYHGASAAEYTRCVFDVLADMYLNPRLSPVDIERERGVIAEEILMYRDDPGQHVQELLCEIIWPDHPLGRPLTGSIETLRAIRREDFLNFRERHYQGRSTLVTFAGKITHAEAESLARTLGNLPRGRARKFASAPPIAKKPRLRTVFRETEQTHLAMAFPAFDIHDERRYALSLLHTLLGGNMSSRLFQELREKRGLCYSVNTHVSQFSDCGALSISCGLDAKNLERSLALIYRECDRLKSQPASAAELRRAKDYTIGMGRMSLEKTSSQNSRLGFSVLTFGKIIDPETVHRKLREVTAEEVQAIAKEVLDPRHLCAAVVGAGQGIRA